MRSTASAPAARASHTCTGWMRKSLRMTGSEQPGNYPLTHVTKTNESNPQRNPPAGSDDTCVVNVPPAPATHERMTTIDIHCHLATPASRRPVKPYRRPEHEPQIAARADIERQVAEVEICRARGSKLLHFLPDRRTERLKRQARRKEPTGRAG